MELARSLPLARNLYKSDNVKKNEIYIIKNFNGKNHKELARITEYSEQWVYEILKEGKDDRQNKLF